MKVVLRCEHLQGGHLQGGHFPEVVTPVHATFLRGPGSPSATTTTAGPSRRRPRHPPHTTGGRPGHFSGSRVIHRLSRESTPVRGGGMVGAGGMETWGGRRSAVYGLMCGSLPPFSGRACRVQAGFMESTRAASYPVPSGRVYESGRCQAIPTHRLCAPPVLTHDHPGDIGREKMPSVENAVGRVQGSGPPHYSGIRFGIRFRGPIRSHPINIAESPEYGRPPPVGRSPNRVRSGRLPIRSHPINPIRSSPAGGVRELHESGRCTLPFRGGNIEGRPRRSSSVRCFGMVRTGSPCFASG